MICDARPMPSSNCRSCAPGSAAIPAIGRSVSRARGWRPTPVAELAEALGGPGVEAARDGRLVAAALRRDMQADDLGVGDQRRVIRRVEEALRLGVHRIKALL